MPAATVAASSTAIRAAASVLTLSPTGGSTTFSGLILGGGTLGTISLVMNGGGMQVLAGTNTYTGGTTISSGVLSFVSTNCLQAWNLVEVTPSAGATWLAWATR